MLTVKKRICYFALFYAWNVGFSFLCLWIASRGYLTTVRYEWDNLLRIEAMFLLISFVEMCLLMHHLHRKNEVFGKVCIPLDRRGVIQSGLLVLFYVTSFVYSFMSSVAEICFYMFMFLTIAVGTVFMFGSVRFVWFDGEQRRIVNEMGEVYPVKKMEMKEMHCLIEYENHKGRLCKLKLKLSRRRKEALQL